MNALELLEIILNKPQNKAIRMKIRDIAGARQSNHITIVEGDKKPKITGDYYHFTTRGGTPIHYPNAYARNGWSNMVYHPSTIKLEVGAEYVIKAIKTSK